MERKRLVFALALLLWIVSVYELITVAILSFFGSTSSLGFVGNLLTQEKWEDRVAPILILLIFAWILIDILILARRAFQEQSAVAIVKGGLRADVGGRLKPTTATAKRFHLLVKSSLDRDEARDVIASAAELDDAAMEDRVGMTRVLVWILPVLGFIGTAWGMSHAIGGFSQALKETSDMAVLTSRLSQLVIPGLAHAFSVTILALSTAAITHFCVSVVQSWNSDALTELDRVSLGWTSELPRGGTGAFDREISELLRQVASKLDSLVNKIPSLESAAHALTEAASTLKSAGEQMSRGAIALEQEITRPYHVTIERVNNPGDGRHER